MTHSWYLGIDFSTSGMAARLRDCQQGESYPLYWLSSDGSESRFWVLPMKFEIGKQGRKKPILSSTNPFTPPPYYFRGAVPCYNRQSGQWEPRFCGTEGAVFSLQAIAQELQSLFATFNPSQKTPYRLEAVGLPEHYLKSALLALEGVVLSCSVAWGDTYRFNLREAILGAQLIDTPDRIFFLEEAIAIGLGILGEEGSSKTEQLTPYPLVASSSRLPNGTLIVQGGKITTESALVSGTQLEHLTREDWALRGLEYGEIDLYQDVFYQLLYPQWLPEQEFVQCLNLEIPPPGEPDRPKRDRASVTLQNSPEGQSLLETAKRVVLILQKQEAFSTHLGHQEWGVTRSQFQEKIIEPLWENLNRQINELLSQKGENPRAIARVFCSGEMLALILPFLQSRLSAKFPQAEIVLLQNNNDNHLIAMGLSRLPLFPQMLDRLRHQYSDYFLLAELLHSFPDRPLSLEQIMKSLERRGIPRACLWRILPFLTGQLPQGLIPSPETRVRMEAKSQEFLPYPAIASAPLFTPQPPLYHPNAKQGKRLQKYFSFILATSSQKFNDPLAVNFSIFESLKP
ncbi:hypothetical protein [Spirulina sp. 06S082]|uniref:hypothetical protein n=1 Tax=Spirulina sp. 06S082 TaxID=3110248 RepID=UPI002B203CAE|nr:hypothetical protein [Spirulina sp. 06S082]MEA5470359.1 hypothetical protein [Spirulina sp. 06S082]